MGNSTALMKKQKFLAGVVCSLIVLALLPLALGLGRTRNGSADDALWVASTLAQVLVLLKFLRRGREPRRKWLGWLLGISLATDLLSSFFTNLPDMRDTLFAQLPAWMATYGLIGGIIISFVTKPFFHLLYGVLRKKSTEKRAGVFACINLGIFLISLISMLVQRTSAWPSIIIGIFIETGYIALYFSWPVLTRPILGLIEKEKPPMQQIRFERTAAPKQKPDQNALGFGRYFTDHMFLMNYDEGQGWHDPRIVPYGSLALDPAAMCLHYGQEVFEGMKAYFGVDGKIRLFRPEENMARLNLSNDRLCIPPIDEALAVHAIEELVKVDRDWIPTQDGTSLYIRPFIFAVDPFVGVRPASHLIFCIILSPVGAYYPEGLNPIKIFVENQYVRAVRGGTGFAKAGGNYAASLKAQQEAQAQGFTQVLWLDGIERKYIEEVGTMNVFFVFENDGVPDKSADSLGCQIVTPALSGSILGGITRKSCIAILRGWGFQVTERPLALEEVTEAAKAGNLKEAFGSGTAAVVSPIGALHCGGETLGVNNGAIGELTQRLYDELTGIQWGKVEDTRGWTKVIG